MTKLYSIYLDNRLIGTTRLEYADAPMGVVFGKIQFTDQTFGYDFIKDYCESKNIEIVNHDPDHRFISTSTIDYLTIKNENGIEIVGNGNQITGMDNEDFEISIEGVPYPFFEEEFPHHVKEYKEMFKEK